jgi:hypothetical protein
MAKISFLRDIYANAGVLYSSGQIVEMDYQIACAFVRAGHAVACDCGLKMDKSSTPGDATMHSPQGRCAFPVGATQVVVTNSWAEAGSTVLLSLGGNDATLLHLRVTPADGSFTVRGNAAATGVTPFDFEVRPR